MTSYRFTAPHSPTGLEDLSERERAQLPIALARIIGDDLPLEEAATSFTVWRVIDDKGVHVFDLWADDPQLWMDCCLFEAGSPSLVPVVMIQHGFQALGSGGRKEH